MKVLVTGSNGQLGSEIKKYSGELKHVQFDFHDIDTLDLTDNESLKKYFESNKPDFVINCAAYTAVDKAEEDKEGALTGNCTIVKNLIGHCQTNDSYFIHISTDYVFDGTNHKPYNEDDGVNPQGEYGRTKLMGEKEALQYKKTIVIRTSWLYSAYGNNFVKTMLRLGKERKELNVIFDQVGSPTNAADLAKAILSILDQNTIKNTHFEAGIYHFSNEGLCSWYDFAKTIMELKGLRCKINPIETSEYPTPAKRPFYSVLNKKKIKDTFGINILHWRDSLKDCLSKIT